MCQLYLSSKDDIDKRQKINCRHYFLIFFLPSSLPINFISSRLPPVAARCVCSLLGPEKKSRQRKHTVEMIIRYCFYFTSHSNFNRKLCRSIRVSSFFSLIPFALSVPTLTMSLQPNHCVILANNR